MKKMRVIFIGVLALVLLAVTGGCGSSSSSEEETVEPEVEQIDEEEPEIEEETEEADALPDGQVSAPMSASECVYQNYEEIQSVFESAGFTNIQVESVADLTTTGQTIQEGDVKQISIDDYPFFQSGTTYSNDVPVKIIYHLYKEKENTATNDDTVLTVENCEELTTALQDEAAYSNFVRTYKGRTIKFDATIVSVSAHATVSPFSGERKVSSSLFDIWIKSGDYTSGSIDDMPGPEFKMDSVPAIKLPGVDLGDPCVLTAKVGSYDSDSGDWTLTFVSMEKR